MANKHLPSAEVLRQLLRYDSTTGLLFWRERDVSWFPTSGGAARWNGKHAGKVALTSQNRQGYLQGQVLKVCVKAHRVAWAIHYGHWPDHVDHINGDVKDNRIVNLRSVSQADNNRNAKVRRDNKTGFPGIQQYGPNGRWKAVIGNDYIGLFDTLEQAISARKAAQAERGFHRNHGRAA